MTMAIQVALLTRWEWFKLRRRWVPWILLGIILAISQLVFWLAVTLGEDLSYRSTTDNIANGLGISSFFSPVIAVILASTVVGGEYGWGTLRPVLSRGVGRWPFLASKLAVVWLAVAASLLIVAILTAVSSFIAEAVLVTPEASQAYNASWSSLLGLFGRVAFGFLPYAALAIFVAVLTGSNGLGIGLSLGYYFVENVILVPVLSIFSWSGQVFAFILGPNVAAWHSLNPAEESAISAFGGLSDMAHGAVFVTIYAVALAAAALALFLRRDIAGAKGG